MPSEMDQWAGDINEDQTVDINDVLLMISVILE